MHRELTAVIHEGLLRIFTGDLPVSNENIQEDAGSVTAFLAADSADINGESAGRGLDRPVYQAVTVQFSTAFRADESFFISFELVKTGVINLLQFSSRSNLIKYTGCYCIKWLLEGDKPIAIPGWNLYRNLCLTVG